MTKTSKAYAKINLSLDVIEKMQDGYHYLISVMQSVGLNDEITVKCLKSSEKNERGKISIVTGVPYLPGDERNIAAKAALSFFEHTGITGYDIDIVIQKKIPVCAGLGGGSTDAACVLRMLNDIFETGLARQALETLGNTLGSDIPFCIEGGTKLAKGRGEILTDLPSMPHSYIVICKPPFSCSTPELFKRIDCGKIHARPDTDGLVKSLEAGDLLALARHMYNVFEDILPQGKREIEEIKSTLLDNSALGCVMTGTGPSVFGIFNDHVNAQNAYKQLITGYTDCFLTETI